MFPFNNKCQKTIRSTCFICPVFYLTAVGLQFAVSSLIASTWRNGPTAGTCGGVLAGSDTIR